ncbi:MAG: DUF1573 domain-containing protein [Bacteroidales bacterium]|nr:DUF1573 domain-containing protein [Bacteroidales bacterium]
MKRIVSTLILLLALTAAAELRWETTTVDFGTIREDDGRATRFFRFRNVGDSAVDITRIRTSCGCTSSDYVRHGIQPGEADSIPIHYNPIGRPGSYNKFISLTATDSTYTLHIVGNVIPSEVTLADRFPHSIGALRTSACEALFGDVISGRSRSARISAYNISNDTIVLDFDRLPEMCSAIASPDTIPPGNTTSIVVTFRTTPSMEFGWQSHSIDLIQNGKPFPISVTATVKAAPGECPENAPVAEIVDEKIIFADYGSQKHPKASLTVRNSGGSPLVVKHFASEDTALAASTTLPTVIEPGKSAKIGFTLDPAKETDYIINKELIIYTNDPAKPNRTIRLVGNK